ncbi:MAG: TolC family protein [Oligoflexales bacterium]|nr:TolC family protein [Oligoflexales bacterium]
MIKNNCISNFILVSLLILRFDVSFGKNDSSFKKVLKAVDPYALPPEIKKTMPKGEFFNQILSANLQIQQARLDNSFAKLTHEIDRKMLLPQLNLGVSSSDSSATSFDRITTLESTNRTKSSSFTLGIGGETDWGFNYNFNLPKISKDESISPFSTQESSTLNMGATFGFHLLKNNVISTGGAKSKVSKLTFDTAREGFRKNLISALYSGENLYYSVFQKQAQLQIINYTFAATKALLADTKELFKQGEIANFELVQVELQVAQTESQVVAAQQEYKNAIEDLKGVINAKESIYPDPKEILTLPVFETLSFEELFAVAKANRSDYRTFLWKVENDRLNATLSYSNTLPSLDLGFQYQKQREEESVSKVLEKPLDLHSPQKSITLTLTYDLFNYQAKNSYIAAKNQLKKDDLDFETLQNQIKREIMAAINAAEAAQQKLKLSSKSKGLSLAKLQAEFDRYQIGESSIRNIIDFQKDGNSAETDELNSRIDLHRAASNLRKVQGLAPEEVGKL